jgi:four helix bundle protein
VGDPDRTNNRAGHRQMIVWQNTDQLDLLVQQKILPKIPKHEFKLRSQIDSASDSIGSNFVEGYYSGALGEYIRFLKYGRRSLAELEERVRRVFRKGYLAQTQYITIVISRERSDREISMLPGQISRFATQKLALLNQAGTGASV